MTIPFYFGCVHLEPVGDLAQTAHLLGEVLGQLSFVLDRSGKFDEYPAYIATRDGLEYALLGIPNPEDDIREDPMVEFELQVNPIDPGSGDDVDISPMLLDTIAKDGRIKAWALK